MKTAPITCRCNLCNGEIEFTANRAGETIVCPWCAQETELYIPGGLVRAQPIAAPPQPPPPILPAVAAVPQVVINMPSVVPAPVQQGPSFGSTFKTVFYVCLSLVILFILALVGLGFLSGLAQASKP